MHLWIQVFQVILMVRMHLLRRLDLLLQLIQESQVGPMALSYLYCLKARSYLRVQLDLCFLELLAIQSLLENLCIQTQ